MQINSSLQAPDHGSTDLRSENAGETARENLQTSAWGPKKKAKPGLFAMLLDGLTGKSKKTFNNNEIHGELSDKKPEKAGFHIKKDKLLFDRENIAGQNSQTGKNNVISKKTELNSLKPDMVSQKKDENRVKDPNHFPVNTGELFNPIQANFIQKNAENEFNIHLDIPGHVKTDSDIHAIPVEISAAAPMPNSISIDQNLQNQKTVDSLKTDSGEQTIQKEKNKPQKAAVDVFPARNHDNRFYQFTGEPKPAAVDNVFRNDLREISKEDSRAPESRGKKGRERINIEVRDFRTAESRPAGIADQTNPVNASVFANERPDAEIPVELSVGSAKEIGGKTASSVAGFEEALSQKLGEGLNSDIVRQATVILRNGGEGTIRLSLKPETLGNVKIRLEMSENKITGHIIVESSEAMRAFERELPVLEKAFRDSGFAEASLDMFMAQDNGNFRQQQDEFRTMIPELAAFSYESESGRNTAAISEITGGPQDRAAVNLLI